jgi:3-polyprenyl-4-hydroxybenzoate decarboxylase
MNDDSASAPKGLLVKPTIMERLAKIATNLKDALIQNSI